MTTALAAMVVVIGLAVSSPAAAHNVVASVFASGSMVEGEIGLSSGAVAEGVLVEVFDANGAKLGETTTDADGFFVFTPTRRTDLVFRADLGGGHVAEARMAAADVPAGPGVEAAGVEEAGGAPGAGTPALRGDADAGGLSEAERQALARIVRDEMKPLRREIAQYKEKNDLRSILGGIGYIVGLFGLGFYLAARRRLRQG